MKLFRYRNAGKTLPGVAIGNRHYNLSDHIQDINRDFFEHGGVDNVVELINQNTLNEINEPEFDAAIYRPGKVVCIGLNYLKHAEESGMPIPKEPVLFFKSPSSICGPYDRVMIPKNSVKTDWEVELAIVIGKRCSYIEESEVMDHIAGYVLHNDISEREFQLERGGQWVKGKSCDTFAPLGPYIVTTDEIPDPNSLDLWLKVNDELVQNGNTSDFIFNVQTSIAYISQFMTLEPGDVISTGTPKGVGLGFDPPRYLKPGDVMELGVEGLGVSRQEVIAFKH
jgi:2-keto-4-pentenoate hydratase/2-oxohepta-3-ene-1,7-dioic acid hydratase in catechol pathway